MATATKAKAKAAPVVEDTDDDVELEELDEDVETEAAKAKDEVTFGASDLAKLLSKKTGKEITPRQLRVLLRKMARDGSNRVNREIKEGNRSRYSWSGPDDPEVKAIVKAVLAGELEQGQKEALQRLKDQKAAKKAAAPEGTTKKKAKAPAPEPDEDDDDFVVEDDDE